MAETILQLRPAFQERRDARVYEEPQVKKILYGFARDIERKRKLTPWRADKLRRVIENIFDFDVEVKK